MPSSKLSTLLTTALYLLALTSTTTHANAQSYTSSSSNLTFPISPKIFIISMFSPEATIWHGIPEFNLLAHNITIPGFSPLFPTAHCTPSGDICQMVTGESEINAAASVSALTLSSAFNLTSTYFLIAGIAGVNPEVASTGSVTFARYAVQVALQYEFDAREMPANFSTGYFPQGAEEPDEYPQEIYGTEVFEVSEALRQVAIGFASTAALNDTAGAARYRARYGAGVYAAGAKAPFVVGCDVATSDVYFSGTLLSQAFANTTQLFTNGSGIYCTTAQEDNATLESLLRAAISHKVDFSRIIIMRTASDYDRPPPGTSPYVNLIYGGGGFGPAITNIYRAGVKVVLGIVDGWEGGFANGVAPGNYVGDIFGSLGGKPDFGLPSKFIQAGGVVKREMKERDYAGERARRRMAGIRGGIEGRAGW